MLVQLQQLTDNMLTYGVEIPNYTHNIRNSILVCIVRTIFVRTARMLQLNKKNKKTLFMNKLAHPERSQNKTENVAMTWVVNKKAMVSHTCIIDSMNMYKISDKVINSITKNM